MPNQNSNLSPNASLHLSPPLPPKIHIGPKPKPGGGESVSWKSRGQELIRKGPSDKIRPDFMTQFSKFELHVEQDGEVTIIAVKSATIQVGSSDGGSHTISITTNGNETFWSLDDQPLGRGTSSPLHDGLPPHFFGDFQGITGIPVNYSGNLSLILD